MGEKNLRAKLDALRSRLGKFRSSPAFVIYGSTGIGALLDLIEDFFITVVDELEEMKNGKSE